VEEPVHPDLASQLASLLPELTTAMVESVPQHPTRVRLEAPRLTGRQMAAVIALARRGPLRMGEFAAALDIRRAAATELADRLAEKGVVRRERDAGDRRIVRLRLAGDAERFARQTLERWGGQVEAALGSAEGLDPAALLVFLHALVTELKGGRPA
jgi:DNA-binding MarR family transcriptional regulator